MLCSFINRFPQTICFKRKYVCYVQSHAEDDSAIKVKHKMESQVNQNWYSFVETPRNTFVNTFIQKLVVTYDPSKFSVTNCARLPNYFKINLLHNFMPF
jgi:hypothetical protein